MSVGNFLKAAFDSIPEVEAGRQRRTENELSNRLNRQADQLNQQKLTTGRRAISEDALIKTGTAAQGMSREQIKQNFPAITRSLISLGLDLDEDDLINSPENIENIFRASQYVQNQRLSGASVPTDIRVRQSLLNDAQLQPTGNETPEQLQALNDRRDSARAALQVAPKAGTLSTPERLAKDPSTADVVAGQAASQAGQVEEAKLSEQLKFKPKIEAAVVKAKSEAKRKGEAFTSLKQAEAALPGLLETTDKLRELAPLATHTIAGKVWNFAVKESGFGATEGATAKAQFISTINNQVLPLLKPTFGAAFTVAEGDALRATLGDPDTTPEEKMAVIDSFIDNKFREIQTLNRELAENPVFINHPSYGRVTMDDIEETLRQNPNMTMKDVVDQIRGTGGQ